MSDARGLHPTPKRERYQKQPTLRPWFSQMVHFPDHPHTLCYPHPLGLPPCKVAPVISQSPRRSLGTTTKQVFQAWRLATLKLTDHVHTPETTFGRGLNHVWHAHVTPRVCPQGAPEKTKFSTLRPSGGQTVNLRQKPRPPPCPP